MASFSTQVNDWANKARRTAEAVAKQSTQTLFQRITDNLSGGMVNVDTGFLRASARASIQSMPEIDRAAYPKEGQSYQMPFDVSVTISNLQLGQTIYVGWTAAYAGHVHDGTAVMAGRPYVDLAASEWGSIVEQTVNDLKDRLGQ